MSKTKLSKSDSSKLIEKFTSIKSSELKIVFWSFVYFFMLLASYFILRPLRDEMGIANGASNMQWLFSGTFVVMLIIVPIFGYITSKFKIGSVLTFSHLFFIINISLFYYLFKVNLFTNTLPVVFFIWLSVFNLFAISLFWSFMVDIFTSKQSKRLFGIISAGGSLGAILGPLISTFLSNKIGVNNMFLIAIILLCCSLIALQMVIHIQKKIKVSNKSTSNYFKNTLLTRATLFNAIKLVMASKYLKGLVFFIILYATTSTFLYFEQANIIERSVESSSERVQYFSTVDLITNTIAIFGQFFLTCRIIKQFGLSLSLSLIPYLIAIGFIILSTNTTLIIIAILLIVHRAGNYILLRPGREILYTVCNREEKYKAKNFIDTAVYRGGDAISGWFFAGLISLGYELSIIAVIAVPFIILWGYIGFNLGKKQVVSQEKIHINLNTIK